MRNVKKMEKKNPPLRWTMLGFVRTVLQQPTTKVGICRKLLKKYKGDIFCTVSNDSDEYLNFANSIHKIKINLN